jgi:EthD domain
MAESVPVCLVLLVQSDTADPSSFEAEVETECRRLTGIAETSSVTMALNRLRASTRSLQTDQDLAALEGLSKTGLPPSLGTPIDSFDAVLEIRGPAAERCPSLVSGLAQRLPGTDAGRDVVFAGREHVITAGEAPVRVFYCLHRTPDLTPEAFSQEWLEGLTKHTRHTPGMAGYRQIHLDRALSAEAGEAAGTPPNTFDGVALEWYADLRSLLSAVDWVSEPDSAAAAAEQNLFDFSSARALLAINH